MKCVEKEVKIFDVMKLCITNIDEVIDFVGSNRYIPENLKSDCKRESNLEFVVKHGIGVRGFSSFETAKIGDYILVGADGFLTVYTKEMFDSKFNLVWKGFF